MKQTFLQKLTAWIIGVWCFVIAGFCVYEFFWKKNCALSLRLSAFAAVIIAAAVLVLPEEQIHRLTDDAAVKLSKDFVRTLTERRHGNGNGNGNGNGHSPAPQNGNGRNGAGGNEGGNGLAVGYDDGEPEEEQE